MLLLTVVRMAPPFDGSFWLSVFIVETHTQLPLLISFWMSTLLVNDVEAVLAFHNAI